MYEPTSWWRVIRNGKLWAETSSEKDARSRMESGDELQRLYQEINYEWRIIDHEPSKKLRDELWII